MTWTARFAHAVRHEATLRYGAVLRIAFGAAGVALIGLFLRWLGAVVPVDIWSEAYVVVMIIVGAVFTVESFGELQNDGHRIAYLMRPATTAEKVGAKLVVSAVGSWLVVTLAFLVVSIIATLAFLLLGGDLSLVGTFFADGRWLVIAGETFLDFLPIHAIALFGGVYFRKHPVGKTFFAGVAWAFSYAIASILAARVVFARYIQVEGGEIDFALPPGPRGMFNLGSGMDGEFWRQLVPWYLQRPDLIEPIGAIAVVVIFWGLTWLRLRETEA